MAARTREVVAPRWASACSTAKSGSASTHLIPDYNIPTSYNTDTVVTTAAAVINCVRHTTFQPFISVPWICSCSFLFDIDINGSMLKLPFNLGDDPYMAAQQWLWKNDVDQGFLDQVESTPYVSVSVREV